MEQLSEFFETLDRPFYWSLNGELRRTHQLAQAILLHKLIDLRLREIIKKMVRNITSLLNFALTIVEVKMICLKRNVFKLRLFIFVDFGIVLGCRLYVKEVTRENIGVKPGDVLTRISGIAADNMSLKEARKLMDQCKDRLSIVITRDSSCCHVQQQVKTDSGEYLSGASYSSQNLYVPPPTRQPLEDKSNLVPRGRSRGPLMDVSLSQLDLPATPTVDPPRPPPPRPEGIK